MWWDLKAAHMDIRKDKHFEKAILSFIQVDDN